MELDYDIGWGQILKLVKKRTAQYQEQSLRMDQHNNYCELNTLKNYESLASTWVIIVIRIFCSFALLIWKIKRRNLRILMIFLGTNFKGDYSFFHQQYKQILALLLAFISLAIAKFLILLIIKSDIFYQVLEFSSFLCILFGIIFSSLLTLPFEEFVTAFLYKESLKYLFYNQVRGNNFSMMKIEIDQYFEMELQGKSLYNRSVNKDTIFKINLRTIKLRQSLLRLKSNQALCHFQSKQIILILI